MKSKLKVALKCDFGEVVRNSRRFRIIGGTTRSKIMFNRGDIVKVRGQYTGYKDTYTVVGSYLAEYEPIERVVLIIWQEPHTNKVISQFVSEMCIEVVPQKNKEAA